MEKRSRCEELLYKWKYSKFYKDTPYMLCFCFNSHPWPDLKVEMLVLLQGCTATGEEEMASNCTRRDWSLTLGKISLWELEWHRNRLLRQVVEYPSLGVIKKWLHMALSAVVQWTWCCSSKGWFSSSLCFGTNFIRTITEII